MELRHLRYFLAVAEELHFRRAAERLHVAQPSVSDQIRKLEAELGVRLLDRTQRSVSLTAAGAALRTEARRVLDQAELARVAARTARDGAGSRLRVGYVSASLPASVPRALQRLAGSISQLETTVEPGSAADLLDAVRAQRLHAAIVSLPAPTMGLRVTPLDHQRIVAAVSAGHRLATGTRVRLDQMAPERVVVLARDANSPFYDAVVATCRAAGLSPTFVEMPDAGIERALLCVASGAGVALLPESVADRYAAPGLRFLPLAGDAHVVPTVVATTRDSTHLPTAAFLRAVTGPHTLRPAASAGLPAAA